MYRVITTCTFYIINVFTKYHHDIVNIDVSYRQLTRLNLGLTKTLYVLNSQYIYIYTKCNHDITTDKRVLSSSHKAAYAID